MENSFKKWWFSQTIGQEKRLKNQIKETCGWSNDVWHYKLTGKTPLKKLEKKAIAEIAGKPLLDIFPA